jgi:hypothetical protein
MIQKVKIKEIKPNPNNPRLIKDDKFKKLVKSIQGFPEMLEIRPIVVNDEMIVLGGNMRLKACIEAGLKDVPIIKASNLTIEQQNEFIIKDNVGFGEWDWDILANEWDTEQLEEWGLDVPSLNSNNNYFETTDYKSEYHKPSSTDDDYSTFELVMLHENKLILIDTLNKVKKGYLFEKLEDALMEIIRVYSK